MTALAALGTVVAQAQSITPNDHVHAMMVCHISLQPHLMRAQPQCCELFVKLVLNAKAPLPAHILACSARTTCDAHLYKLQSHSAELLLPVGHPDFQQIVFPAITKALKRSPEVALPGLPQLFLAAT